MRRRRTGRSSEPYEPPAFEIIGFRLEDLSRTSRDAERPDRKSHDRLTVAEVFRDARDRASRNHRHYGLPVDTRKNVYPHQGE